MRVAHNDKLGYDTICKWEGFKGQGAVTFPIIQNNS